jgi:hypothetical protein
MRKLLALGGCSGPGIFYSYVDPAALDALRRTGNTLGEGGYGPVVHLASGHATALRQVGEVPHFQRTERQLRGVQGDLAVRGGAAGSPNPYPQALLLR